MIDSQVKSEKSNFGAISNADAEAAPRNEIKEKNRDFSRFFIVFFIDKADKLITNLQKEGFPFFSKKPFQKDGLSEVNSLMTNPGHHRLEYQQPCLLQWRPFLMFDFRCRLEAGVVLLPMRWTMKCLT